MAHLISKAVVGDLGEVHDSQLNELGMIVPTTGGGEAIYLAGVASTAEGSWVNYTVGTDFSTALLDTDVAATVVGKLAVASAAIVAGKYGWYYIGGHCSALSLTAATDAKNCFATATAGSCDDANAGAETTIFNAFYTGAVDETTLLAPVFLDRPYMIGITLD